MNNNPRQNNDDLKDSLSDEKKVQAELSQMDLPEGKNPGQEHINPSDPGEDISNTILSDDEEEYDELDDDEIGVGD